MDIKIENTGILKYNLILDFISKNTDIKGLQYSP